jgi:hypothetical protein
MERRLFRVEDGNEERNGYAQPKLSSKKDLTFIVPVPEQKVAN